MLSLHNNHKTSIHIRFALILFLTVFIANTLCAQTELLLKIPETSDHQIRLLKARFNIKLRYRTQDYSIIQAYHSTLPDLPSAEVLDSISPGFDYYILMPTSTQERTKVERYGEIIDAASGLLIFKLRTDFEPVLFDLPVHHRAKLPADVAVPEVEFVPYAPSGTTQQQSVIHDLLNLVDSDQWFRQIIALVENEDLSRPGSFFRSRFALRVREAIQLDGNPKPDHACDNAADYIAEQFRSYGLQVEFDSFPHRRRTALGDPVGEYVMRNVVATLPGKGPNKGLIYLVTAHYDSIASKTPGWEQSWRTLPAPGASDNASGVAEIIETARILSNTDFDHTIRFIAFSGEELFLFGSRHYRDLVKQRGDQIAGVLNFDLLGHDPDGILDIHVLGNEQSQWLVNAFAKAAEKYDIPVDLRMKNDSSFIFSDHSPFWDIGIPAVMISEESSLDSPEESIDYIHSQEDNLDKISRPLFGEIAIKLGVATLAELARPIKRPGEADELRPDIYWESSEIEFSNPTPTEGDEVILHANVKNAGPIAVTGIKIRFVAESPNGDFEVLLDEAVNLDVGESKMISAAFTPSAWGEFTLLATANSEVHFLESDFSNNQIETPLPVTDPGVTVENLYTYPNPIDFNRDGASLRFVYTLSRDADITIGVYNVSGEKVFEELFSAGSKNGRLGVNDSFTWSGLKTFGEKVAPGIYVGRISATALNGASSQEETKFAVIW